MLINQDTFKDGKLDFGPNESAQRDRLWHWRWKEFIMTFGEKYPEISLKLLGQPYSRKMGFLDNILQSSFTFKIKLTYALEYDEMESINSAEFDKIIKKFKIYLNHPSSMDGLTWLIVD